MPLKTRLTARQMRRPPSNALARPRLVKTSALVLSLTLAGLVTLASSPAVHAAQLDLMKALIDQGKYWQAHGRGDLAEPAWQKILSTNPKQPEALFGMGMALADRKDTRGAAEYLERLRQVAPDYPDMDSLSRRLGETSERDERLNDARRFAQMGQSASSVQAYRQAMSGKPAAPELRREYYQALAATPNGWNEARQGLAELARAYPDDPRYMLAFAQHLTYREATRREGIERLELLMNDSQVGPAARQAWRQALLWIAARPSDQQRFDAYLKMVPDDAAVKARYESMVQQDNEARARTQRDAARTARGRTIAEGFAALDQNNFAAARDRFSSILTSSPNDADALGGMGIAELKQERFEQARNYLERASRAGSPARWREALTGATYWTYTSQAIGAQSNGQFTTAKALFERAIAINPSDVTAQVMLGDALLEHRDAPSAEQAYRMALRRQADHPDAIRGLVGALAAQGRGDEALQYAEQLTAEQQVKAGGLARLRGTAEAAQARASEARGDLGQARSLFEDALAGNPDDPWLRLDLARIYVRQGAIDTARGMMDSLLATHPDMADVLYAGALLAEQTRDGAKGLQLLDRIPVEQRTLAMTALQHRLWVHQQVELATQMARRGANPQAIEVLRNAERFAQEAPSLRGEIAAGYAAVGDTNHALSIVQRAVAQAPTDTNLLLQYADILLTTHQDAPLGAVMRRLSTLQFTPEQRTHFDSLNLAIVIRTADAVRLRGDLAGSYVMIAPWITAMPDNPDLQAALARLYASAGEPSNALTYYQVALARRPDDLALVTAAISAATAAKAWRFAEQTAHTALQAAPDDPQLLAVVGRMYRAEGKLSLASEYLQRALGTRTPFAGPRGGMALANAPRSWDTAMQSLVAHRAVDTNPFEGKTAIDSSRSDDFMGRPTPGATGFASPLPSAPASLNQTLPPTTVPTYLPPAPPTSYIAPSVMAVTSAQSSPNQSVAETLQPSSTRSIANALTRFAAEDYGPDSDSASESGRPTAAPLLQPSARNAYGASSSGLADLSLGTYVATPWPMSPASRNALQADGTSTPAAPLRSDNRHVTPSRSRARPLPQVASTRAGNAQSEVLSADRMARRSIRRPSYPPSDPQLDDASAYSRPVQYPGNASWPELQQPPSDRFSRDATFVQANSTEAGMAGASASPQTLGVADELAQINRALTSSVSGGPTFRHRTGEDGLSNLTDLEASIEGRIRVNNGHVVVTATPVTLDAGTAANDLPTRARFGAGLSNGASPASPGSQTASGVGLSIGYETASLKAHIGTTPVGFRYQELLGDLQYIGGITDKATYALAVTRKAVTDSLLSYAGAHDAAAGLEWGGVTKTGVRAEFGWDDGTSGVYVNGEFQYYNGHHVANNYAGKGSAGAYTRAYQDPDHTLTVGVNVTGMGFTKNQGYFTYGHGGYFSPQQYIIFNLPIEYAGRTGAFTYDLKGSLGVQHYRENAAPYFPLDPGLQAQAQATMNGVTTATLDHNAVYPGQSKTGVAYSLYASGEYQLNPQLAIGAMASLGNANQYRQWLAALYLRFSFTAQSLTQPYPPKVFVTPYLADIY